MRIISAVWDGERGFHRIFAQGADGKLYRTALGTERLETGDSAYAVVWKEVELPPYPPGSV